MPNTRTEGHSRWVLQGKQRKGIGRWVLQGKQKKGIGHQDSQPCYKKSYYKVIGIHNPRNNSDGERLSYSYFGG